MTTNAGSDVSSSVMGFTEGTAGASGNSKTEKALSGFLRPEFINRIDEIITFRQLDKDDFTKIAVIMLDELKSALEEKSISLTYSQDVAQIIAEKSFSLKYGARNMRRFIRSAIEDVIANKIINDYERKVSAISIGVTDGDIDIAAI